MIDFCGTSDNGLFKEFIAEVSSSEGGNFTAFNLTGTVRLLRTQPPSRC